MSHIAYNEAAAGLSTMNAVREAFTDLESVFLKPRLAAFQESIIGRESIVWQTASQSAHIPISQMLAFRLATAGQKVLCLLPVYDNVKMFTNNVNYYYHTMTGETVTNGVAHIFVDNKDEDDEAVLLSNTTPDENVLIHVATYATALKNNLHKGYDALLLMGSEEKSLTSEFFHKEHYTAPTVIYMGLSDAPHSVSLLGEKDVASYRLTVNVDDISPEHVDHLTYTVYDQRLTPGKARENVLGEATRLIEDGHRGIFIMFGYTHYSAQHIQNVLTGSTDIPVTVVDLDNRHSSDSINTPPTDGTKVLVGSCYQSLSRLKSFQWLTAGVCDGFERTTVSVQYMNKKTTRMDNVQQWRVNKAARYTSAGRTTNIDPEFVVLQKPSVLSVDDTELVDLNDVTPFFYGLTRLHLRHQAIAEDVLDESDLTHALAMGLVTDPKGGLTPLGTRVMSDRNLSYISHVFMAHVTDHPKATTNAIAAALPIAALMNVRSLYQRHVQFPRTIQKNDPPFDSAIMAELYVLLYYMKNDSKMDKLPKTIRDMPSPLDNSIMPKYMLVDSVRAALRTMIRMYGTSDTQDASVQMNDIYDIYLGDRQNVLDKMGDVTDVVKAALAATFVDQFYVYANKRAVRHDTGASLGVPNLNAYDDDLVCGFPHVVNETTTLLTRATAYEWPDLFRYFGDNSLLTLVENGLRIDVMHRETGRVVAHIESPDMIKEAPTSKTTMAVSTPNDGSMADKLRTAMTG